MRTPRKSLRRAWRQMSRLSERDGYPVRLEGFAAAHDRYLGAYRRSLASGAYTKRGPGPRWLRELRVKLKNPKL